MESLLLRSSLRVPRLIRTVITSTSSKVIPGLLISKENCYNDKNNASIIKRWQHFDGDVKPTALSNQLPEQIARDRPVKFTTSEAYVGYKASRNFYGDDRDLPESHNLVIASTGTFAFFYLIFLRDEQDEGGALSLFKPVYETVPELAVPLLKATIAENKKFGQDTSKLEKKLAEYLNDQDKHGGSKSKLIEN